MPFHRGKRKDRSDNTLDGFYETGLYTKCFLLRKPSADYGRNQKYNHGWHGFHGLNSASYPCHQCNPWLNSLRRAKKRDVCITDKNHEHAKREKAPWINP